MPLPRRKFLQHAAVATAAGFAAPRIWSKLSAAADATAPAASGAPAVAPFTRPMPPAPPPIVAPAGWGVMDGPFQPTFESLQNYQSAPDWFRDAKFGMWAHWGPQCVPEQGDWYAQLMYQENNAIHKFHVAKYGETSKFGFSDILPVF